ncbi:S8 family serine peptidase [Rhizobium sp.]
MALPTDTLFSKQWYLLNGTRGEYDLNVTSVWDDYTGRGVRISVMDDGVDSTHPDLAPNYDADDSYDYGADDADASPFYDDDDHGTAVAGIIGAAANGTGVVGVAYGATLIGSRLDYSDGYDDWAANYAAAFAGAITRNVDIINMSFGSTDTLHTGPDVGVQTAAVLQAVEDGRDGLGIILVKSAGNSRGSFAVNGNDMNDGDTHQIIVAAADRNGFVSEYSSFGPGLLISAFGSPTSGQIQTTDRVGELGYSDDDYTGSFNGTSSAAPMISGVVALMLEANAQLGWRDVQSILAYSARHTGSAINGESLSGSEEYLWTWNGATNWNGGGLHYSADYGYGLVDARAAVRLAETWTRLSTSSNEMTAAIDLLDVQTDIPDNDDDGQTFTAAMAAGLVVERVRVTIDFSAAYTGDMLVFLIGPDGREIALIEGEGASSFDGVFSFDSQAYRGSLSDGDWSVRIADKALGDAVAVRDIKIEVFGSSVVNDNTYFYSDEFSEFLDTHSGNITDTAGIDTINAATVTSKTTVNLSTGKATIDGVSIKVSGIENVYAGDGKDTLVGSKGENILAGGRGADILTGGKGADEFLYLHWRDSSPLKKGFDTITDFAKGDIINLERIDAIWDTFDIDDAFTFISGKKFGDIAGQLRFEREDFKGTKRDFTAVEADLDGDGNADFMIALAGLHKLKLADFVL